MCYYQWAATTVEQHLSKEIPLYCAFTYICNHNVLATISHIEFYGIALVAS